MAEKEELIVGGYYFGSFDDAKQAQREIKNSEYLNDRVMSMNLKQKKAIYDKMLDEKVFKTPVGWEYLKYLRNLLEEDGMDMTQVRPIPLYITFTSKQDNKSYDHVARFHVNTGKSEFIKLKERSNVYLMVIFVLIVLVIGMFGITLTSSTPNIINYKTLIVDQYSSWEEALNQKEAELNEREKALKEGYTYENSGS